MGDLDLVGGLGGVQRDVEVVRLDRALVLAQLERRRLVDVLEAVRFAVGVVEAAGE